MDSLISSIEQKIRKYSNFVSTEDIDVRKDYTEYGYVYLNGRLVGLCENMIDIKNYLINLRRNGVINIFTGIVVDYANEVIDIFTKAGRLSKPVFIVENMHKINGDMSWTTLIQEHIIEYLEVQENATSYICDDPRNPRKYKSVSQSESYNNIHSKR